MFPQTNSNYNLLFKPKAPLSNVASNNPAFKNRNVNPPNLIVPVWGTAPNSNQRPAYYPTTLPNIKNTGIVVNSTTQTITEVKKDEEDEPLTLKAIIKEKPNKKIVREWFRHLIKDGIEEQSEDNNLSKKWLS